jgi:hypothetical protein
MVNTWKCRSCPRIFETVGKRDAHHRSEHQSVLSSIKGGIYRSLTGKFVCLCGKAYQQAQGLKRHQKKCKVAIHEVESQNIEREGTLQWLRTIDNRCRC